MSCVTPHHLAPVEIILEVLDEGTEARDPDLSLTQCPREEVRDDRKSLNAEEEVVGDDLIPCGRRREEPGIEERDRRRRNSGERPGQGLAPGRDDDDHRRRFDRITGSTGLGLF